MCYICILPRTCFNRVTSALKNCDIANNFAQDWRTICPFRIAVCRILADIDSRCQT